MIQVDDDSYVRVGALLARIAETSSERTLLGFIENPGGGPHRNKKSQWYVKPEEWPSDRYPPWAHGAGYVLSQVSSSNIFIISSTSFQDTSFKDQICEKRSWEIEYTWCWLRSFSGSSTDLFQIWASKIRYVRMACEILHMGEYMKPFLFFLGYPAQTFSKIRALKFRFVKSTCEKGRIREANYVFLSYSSKFS